MNKKVVYQTDRNGYFRCMTIAHESPREPGKFLIPAGCIEKQPLYPVGYKAKWVDDDWVYEVAYKTTHTSKLRKLEVSLAFLFIATLERFFNSFKVSLRHAGS